MRKNNEMGSRQLAVCSKRAIRCSLHTAHCLLFTASCILLTACFQPETSCLDIEATNFNLAADEPCGSDDTDNGCPCEYPEFSFDTISYVFDKTTFVSDNSYRVDSQYIRIKSIQFYLSDFRFRRSGGEWSNVEDTISVTLFKDNIGIKDTIFTDDFLLFEKQTKQDIGEVKRNGTFDSLRFVVGLESIANSIIPDSIPRTKHSLITEEMHTENQGEEFIFNQIILQKDTFPDTETMTLNIFGNSNLVEIKMPISSKTTIGKDFSFRTLQINHAKWFDGIKFVTDNDAVMIEKIVANTPNVFSIAN